MDKTRMPFLVDIDQLRFSRRRWTQVSGLCNAVLIGAVIFGFTFAIYMCCRDGSGDGLDFYDFSYDPALSALQIRRHKTGPPSLASSDCLHRVNSLRNGFNSGFDSTATIIVFPDEVYSTVYDYQITLGSLVETTRLYAQNVEILIVTNEQTKSVDHKVFFDKLHESKSFLFRTLIVKSPRETLFQELVHLASDVARHDLVVFMASGTECNYLWLEHLLMPLVQRPHIAATTPHFDTMLKFKNGSTMVTRKETQLQIYTTVDARPQRYQEFLQTFPSKWNVTNEELSPVLLMDVFAVNKMSTAWRGFIDFMYRKKLKDATIFDYAQFAWRCSPDTAIIAVACSSVASPSINEHEEFDPRMTDTTKIRLILTWLDNYRKLAFKRLNLAAADVNTETVGLEACQSIDDYLEETGTNKKLFLVGRFQTGRLRSNEHMCFEGLPERQFLHGTDCNSPITKNNFFIFQENGFIATLGGRCITLPEETDFIELAHCNSTVPNQKWTHTAAGTIESLAHDDTCLTQGADPENSDRILLMVTSCSKAKTDDSWLGSTFTFPEL